MSALKYPMSNPILIVRIPRSDEECKVICSLKGIGYQVNKRQLTVQWELNGSSLVVPLNCAHPLVTLFHQHSVYKKMITHGAPIVKEDRMCEVDLQMYVNVAEYLRDVIYAFKEEWEGEGYRPQFRSARLEFHMAMVLTGGTFNDKNVRKVQEKFNITWNNFVEGVEVTDIMKLNGKEKAYHELFCSDDENMCGLDCYPCIDHGERSLDMIERFIKDREAVWTAKKVTQGRINNRKGKKHISNEPGESADITSSHRIHGISGAKHRAAGNSLEKGRARKRGSLKNSQKAIIEVIAEIQVDAGKSPIDTLTPLLPLSWDNMDALTERAFTEGDGVLVSKNLLSWMTERYRILIGIPLNEPLHGQLIPQSPDEYHNLKEDDYLEALGIERLYAALVNAEESPEHLIHLAHALGRIVKDTNTLSDSKPNTRALDPLPPTKLPGKNTPHRQVISTDRYVGVVPALSKSDSLSKSTGIDDHDGSVSSNVCTSNAAAAHPGSAAKTSTSIDDNPMHIDVNDDDSCMMDAEGVRDGDSDKDDSNNSRDDTDGQRKRKSVDWLAQYSPPNHDGRSHKKWIKPLDSASSSLAESNSTHTVRTPRAIVSDGISTLDVWSMPRHLLLTGPLPMEASQEVTVVPDQVESSSTNKRVEETDIDDTATGPCPAAI